MRNRNVRRVRQWLVHVWRWVKRQVRRPVWNALAAALVGFAIIKLSVALSRWVMNSPDAGENVKAWAALATVLLVGAAGLVKVIEQCRERKLLGIWASIFTYIAGVVGVIAVFAAVQASK